MSDSYYDCNDIGIGIEGCVYDGVTDILWNCDFIGFRYPMARSPNT